MRRLLLLVPLLLCWTATPALAGPAAARAASAADGPWGWPLAGTRTVSRAFAPPATRYGSGHRGADLPSSPGAVVRAAGAGRVSYAGRLAGRGVVVVVHGSLRTTYEPVTASVRVGDAVPLGAALGVLEAGHGGCPQPACLHWGLRRGEDYLDPVRLVEAGPVRLLPMTASGGGPGARAGGAAGERGSSDRSTGGSSSRSPGIGDPPGAPPRATAGPVRELVAAPVSSDRDLPLGLTAVAALALGVALLARGRPAPPPLPPSNAAAGLRSVSPDEPEQAPTAEVLDLDVERLRRRAG